MLVASPLAHLRLIHRQMGYLPFTVLRNFPFWDSRTQLEEASFESRITSTHRQRRFTQSWCRSSGRLLGGVACLTGGIWFYTALPRLRALIRPVYIERGLLAVPDADAGAKTV